MAERKIHSAYIDNKIVCKVCFDKLSDIKPYLRNDGLKQHFRTMHRERFSDSLITECEQLTKRLHGDETRKYLIQFAKHKHEKVCSNYLLYDSYLMVDFFSMIV